MKSKDMEPGKLKQTSYVKSVFPGKYIQGEHALNELLELVLLFGKKGLLIATKSAIRKVIPGLFPDGIPSNLTMTEFIGECCDSELERVQQLVKTHSVEVIIALGGGKTIDTAKIVADRLNLAVIVVPTIASTDAPCSGCAVIYTEDGEFQSVYYQKMNPQIVLMDLNVLVHAPVRYLVAGMGDALATWFEARACQRTNSPNACGGYSTMAGFALAKLCYESLLRYGMLAKTSNELKVVTPAFTTIVEANTLLSGIGFESSGLGTAHSIHNGLTVLKETHALYHGEKVAFGVLTGLHLVETEPDEIDKVYSFCEQIGLPTTFDDLFIPLVTRKDLMRVAEKACQPEEGIHHEPVAINPQRVVAAMLAADAEGRRRRNYNSCSCAI
jgi:glycerol dehydrogenase